ncbi:MAG: 2-hydroxychromene-2-carboxylate isomerase [Alphaproteobacteria bacterium]|nr:2-hydroxychromene-2-carboxylate isomerase [Alphaproteobacteria bacterium]
MTARKDPIAFYFDIFSPFGYLASTQIETVAARHGRTVDWRPVLLGVTVMKIMGMKPLTEYPMKGEYLQRDMERIAQIYGVPFKRHGLKGHNSLNAMRSFAWLKQRDPALAVAFARRMYERLFVRSLDITPVEACVEEARHLGIDGAELAAAIASDEIKQLLVAQVNEAVGQGAFGVPFFIADGEKFFGNDHIPMMELWLEKHAWR